MTVIAGAAAAAAAVVLLLLFVVVFAIVYRRRHRQVFTPLWYLKVIHLSYKTGAKGEKPIVSVPVSIGCKMTFQRGGKA